MSRAMDERRSPAVLLAALTVVVLVTAGALILPRLGGAPLPEPDDRPRAASPSGEASDRRPPGPSPLPARAEPASPEPVDEEDEAEPASVTLRILDVARSPVAGAGVTFVPYDGLPQRLRYAPDGRPDRDAALREHAVSLTADSAGRVELPVFRTRAYVRASKESLYGRTVVNRKPAEQEMVLREDRSLTISVTDAGGHPVAGVPVGLFSHYGGAATIYTGTIWEGTTGKDGTAVVPHGLSYLNGGGRGGPLATVQVAAALAIPTDEPVIEFLNAETPPFEPVRLTLPETGSLVLRIVDQELEPYEEPVGIHLTRMRSAGISLDYRTSNGVLRLPFVGTGLTIRATLAPEGREYRSIREEITGPEVPGTEAEAVIRLDSRNPVVTARLIGPDGERIANRAVRMRFTSEQSTLDRRQGEAKAETDAGGTVRTAVPLTHAPRRSRETAELGSLRIEVPFASGSHEDQPELWVTIPFPAPELGEERDLGRIQLARTPLLVSGRVIEADEKPVQNVEVRAGRRARDRTSDDGTFAIFAPARDSDFELRVAHSGFRQMEKEILFEAGDTDVEIVLRRTTTVAGRILVPSDVPVSQITVSLEGDRRTTRIRPRSDGHFSAQVRPAHESLHLTALGDPEPCLVLPLRVEWGKDNDLGDLDLRSVVRALTLRTLDPDGRAVPQATVRRANERQILGYTNPFGEVSVVTSRPSVAVTVTAAGFLAEELLLAAADQEIMLSPGPIVRIVLPGGLTAPDGLVIDGRLLAKDRRGRRYVQSLDTSDGRSFEFRISEPGTYEARLYLVPESSSGGRRVPLGDPLPVEILDLAAPTEILGPITAADIDRAAALAATIDDD